MLIKDCFFWDKSTGECGAAGHHDEGFGWDQNPEILLDIEVQVDDDSGLNYFLKTGPEFGCIRFSPAKLGKVQ